MLCLQAQLVDLGLLSPSPPPLINGRSVIVHLTSVCLSRLSASQLERLRGLGLVCDSPDDSVYWRDCDAEDRLGA